MKKRIVWLIDRLGPGGAEQITFTLMKHFNREQFDVLVVALRLRGDGEQIVHELGRMNIPTRVIPVKNFRDLAGLYRIVRYLKQSDADLVHTQLELSDTMGNIAAKVMGIPSVSTLHTIEQPASFSSSLFRQKARWSVLRNACDCVVAVSEKTRLHHIQFGKLKAHKVSTMYNGIDLSVFDGLDPSQFAVTRNALNIPEDGKVITTVAVLREQKGLQFMIEAIPAVLEQVPDLYYLIVGEGKFSESLKTLVHERNFNGRVIFAGHRSDIPSLLAISDLFVLPTLADALPTVLMEALAAKVPIVACNVGGVPEIVQHEVNGLLVPPANASELAHACLKLLKNEQFAREMATTGRRIAEERFDIRLQAQKLTDLYHELLG